MKVGIIRAILFRQVNKVGAENQSQESNVQCRYQLLWYQQAKKGREKSEIKNIFIPELSKNEKIIS